MVGEIEGKDGRDGVLAEGQEEWLQQHPSFGLSVILHSPSPLPTASLNHSLKPKIKTQLREKKRRRKTAITLYIKHEMKGGLIPKHKGLLQMCFPKFRVGRLEGGRRQNCRRNERLDKQKR